MSDLFLELDYNFFWAFSSRNSCSDSSDGIDYDDDEEKGRRMIVYVCTVAQLIDGHFVILLLY